MIISEKIRNTAKNAEREMRDLFADIDGIAEQNTERVLDAFREEQISESHFTPSTGYGYGDRGRDTIDAVAARIFRAEAGFMRSSVISGTHALTVGLFGLLRPYDTLLSVTGKPYDTLEEVIGAGKEASDNGSLSDFGVNYEEIPMTDGGIDVAAVKERVARSGGEIKVVFIQRSKGYLSRPTLTVKQIREAAYEVKKTAAERGIAAPFVVVDNCYGEFTETSEPCFDPGIAGEAGVDLVIGSLIKNPGGGMADTGGYLIGTPRAVELAGYRLCCPGVGLDAGASLGQNRNILKGLFYAPHTVAQAMKTAHLAAYVFSALGFPVDPGPFDRRSDIIQTVRLGTPEGLVGFCRGIQSASPIDSHVAPEPWDMPGYSDPVVMAAGAFVNGSSIELSADGPMREPYTAFLQGGLTYESGKLGILRAAQCVLDNKGSK
ncbi:MAG: methionine gamma-lyase family protein [Clostridia bacterium]|nr:methionine gamma-lyase family protein [Clostridia bacterium]